MSSFVGRRDALHSLHDAYAAVDSPGAGADHRAGLVLIGGEAGMGKTALLGRFAAETGARGARVVWGTCWPAEQAPAYWPWTRALIEHLAGWAAERDHPALTLTTFLDVPWNGPYYQRCGFRLLAADEITPGLRALREHEAAHGLDRWPRGCMRRELKEDAVR